MMPLHEKEQLLASVEALFGEGQEDQALAALRRAYAEYSDDPDIAYHFGHLLGEISMGTPSIKNQVLREESIAVLKKLCENLEGIALDQQWIIRRHFYFYSGQHLQNRDLGLQELARGNSLGVLSVGFGCLHHALDLIKDDRFNEAIPLAREGEQALKTLLAIDPPRYGRFLAYALLLAILGLKEAAIKATQSAVAVMDSKKVNLDEHINEMNRLLLLAEEHQRIGRKNS